MYEESLSRRTTLRGAAGLAAAGSLTGCLDWVPFLGEDEQDSSTRDLGPVPSNADMVARADTETLLADEGLRAGLDGGVEAVMVDGQPGSIGGFIDWLEAIYGLDAAGISQVVGFTDVTPADPIESTLGALVEASWTPESIPASLDGEGFRVSEYTVDGVTVYDVEREISQVAILEEGRYLIGTADAVEKVVAIEHGEAEALSGGPLSAFREAGEGMIRFGARIEPLIGGITTLFPVATEQIADLLSNVETMGGRVLADGENRRLEVRFSLVNESRAEDFANVIEAAVIVSRNQVEDGTPLVDALNAMSLEQDGSLVQLDYEAGVAELDAQVPALLDFFVGPVVDLPDPDEMDLPGG